MVFEELNSWSNKCFYAPFEILITWIDGSGCVDSIGDINFIWIYREKSKKKVKVIKFVINRKTNYLGLPPRQYNISEQTINSSRSYITECCISQMKWNSMFGSFVMNRSIFCLFAKIFIASKAAKSVVTGSSLLR